MYRKISAILFPLAAVLLVGAIVWGYQVNRDKNAVLIKAENQYQRAFHELSHDMDQLHNQLGNTLAVNNSSHNYYRKGLINVWRLTSEAQNQIHQLPLTLVPIHDTENFLAHVSGFAYKTAVRDLTKNPLSAEEQATLKELYGRSDELRQELRSMQAVLLDKNLRWMDVEAELVAAEGSGTDLVNGFRTVDDKVRNYPKLDWGPAVTAMFQSRKATMLQGDPVTPEVIRERAAAFMGMQSAAGIEVRENGQGTEYSSYSAILPAIEGRAGDTVEMDFTKAGGQLMWYANPRSVAEPQLSAEEAKAKAEAFLEAHGYSGLKPVAYDGNDESATLTFVAVQDEVYLYPDKLSVKIALDNGECVGLQATDYVYEHHKRELQAPALTAAEAGKALHTDFKVEQTRKALVMSEMMDEVLCYEFVGKINSERYRVFINADSGVEEMIERLNG